MHVIKPEGGNWLGGNLAGGVDKRLESLKTETVAGKTPAQRIPMHEQLLKDPSLNDEGRATVQRHLDVTKGEAAVDKWIENNIHFVTISATDPSATIGIAERADSAIVKLSKLTVASTVYRGVHDFTLPDKFWTPNRYNVRGGIDGASIIHKAAAGPQGRIGARERGRSTTPSCCIRASS
jgi:hypothetical protein